jgi:hypothetical protein
MGQFAMDLGILGRYRLESGTASRTASLDRFLREIERGEQCSSRSYQEY